MVTSDTNFYLAKVFLFRAWYFNLRLVLQAKGVSITQLSSLHFPQSGSAWMATQATLRFLAKNEGSPGAHLYGMKRQLAKERPLPMPLAFSFLVSFLPPFQFRPPVLPFYLLFVQSLVRSIFRSFALTRSLSHSSVRHLIARSSVVRCSIVRSSDQSFVHCKALNSWARSLPAIRDLKQTTTATATRPPPNKKF